MIETIKGGVTYVTAAIALILAMVMAFVAFQQPIPEDPARARDIGILYGFLGLIVGAALQFLFNAETSTRAARATERAAESGAAHALASPNGSGAVSHLTQPDLSKDVVERPVDTN